MDNLNNLLNIEEARRLKETKENITSIIENANLTNEDKSRIVSDSMNSIIASTEKIEESELLLNHLNIINSKIEGVTQREKARAIFGLINDLSGVKPLEKSDLRQSLITVTEGFTKALGCITSQDKICITEPDAHNLLREHIDNTSKESINISSEYLIRETRLFTTTKMLIDRFGEDIKITLGVNTNTDIIDIFIKMSDKRSFALMLRSNGASFIRWRADRQELFSRKQGRKGTQSWASGTRAIEQLKSTLYLRKQKSPILGSSSSERSKPITKAIVLTGRTRLDRNNSTELLVKFGRADVLQVKTDLLTYVVQREDLVNFLLPPEK